MRTQSEPPGPSVNDDPQSLPSSPNSSATTGISTGSLGLQYRGAWCTPPRIFMDHQDEIIPHLEPGRAPSTVDPDSISSPAIDKRPTKRQVHRSAWKLAKLDSREAIKAAAKARASSSVMRPITTRNQYDTDQCSSGKASSRSSNADVALHRESRPGARNSSPLSCSYPASREETETCPHTPSSYNSPHHSSNSSVLGSASDLQASDTRHFNPTFQTSARSPWSSISNSGEGLERGTRRSSASTIENRSSVYWDPEAGRFVSAQSAAGATGHGGRTELLYTGQSIFFDGPILGDGAGRNLRNGGAPYQQQGGVVRGRASDQLPVFVPSDSRK